MKSYKGYLVKVVLYQPQIPQNTGNIGRLCVGTNTFLYLVGPLGFRLDEKQIRRSGLDYWEHLEYKLVKNLDEVINENPESKLWFFTTKSERSYASVEFKEDDILVFGSEDHGLPENLLQENKTQCLTIPMWGKIRSLNLSTSVGVALYEAYRQVGKL